MSVLTDHDRPRLVELDGHRAWVWRQQLWRDEDLDLIDLLTTAEWRDTRKAAAP